MPLVLLQTLLRSVSLPQVFIAGLLGMSRCHELEGNAHLLFHTHVLQLCIAAAPRVLK